MYINVPVKAADDHRLSTGAGDSTHKLLLPVLLGVVKLLDQLTCGAQTCDTHTYVRTHTHMNENTPCYLSDCRQEPSGHTQQLQL